MKDTNNEKKNNPHELAKKFEVEIKETIIKNFTVPSEELTILFDDEAGIYLSKKEPNTLCCLVVGEKDGHLYLVTAEIEKDNKGLGNFKTRIIS